MAYAYMMLCILKSVRNLLVKIRCILDCGARRIVCPLLVVVNACHFLPRSVSGTSLVFASSALASASIY